MFARAVIEADYSWPTHAIGDERKVSIRYVVSERYFGAGNRAKQFRCSGKRTIETGIVQSFTATDRIVQMFGTTDRIIQEFT